MCYGEALWATQVRLCELWEPAFWLWWLKTLTLGSKSEGRGEDVWEARVGGFQVHTLPALREPSRTMLSSYTDAEGRLRKKEVLGGGLGRDGWRGSPQSGPGIFRMYEVAPGVTGDARDKAEPPAFVCWRVFRQESEKI